MKRCFISGSMSIRKLPQPVITYLDKIIRKEHIVLVGDAPGVDRLVQEYCCFRGYYNVVVYSVLEPPRNYLSNRFRLNVVNVPERVKGAAMQQEKDKVMTEDSDYSFVVWDGRSKGSYANILRSIRVGKPVDVYLVREKRFIGHRQIREEDITKIFKREVGYSARDLLDYLHPKRFKRVADVYSFLIEKKLLKKVGNVYLPVVEKDERFKVRKWRGRIVGVTFTDRFINWWHKNVEPLSKENSLF